ncbi:SCO family protein [Pseudooceanicola sp. CBS1P-1]|uniref:SCO family protein n=1 Tax=Pseudooceanicola albus TaxID=2692189 RepID=A0A6L7G065_9RHOB|nr:MULTISPECIES: SCO family protein [Pseudooceanicola]MBT9385733.1 SCO family protein [Pseudooceanicola endophyticus]MXN16767.1 SCO family protein [Pseudooceanicola albus]
MQRLYAIAAVIAMGGLLGGTWYATRPGGDDALAACRTGRIAGGTEQIGGSFTLLDETGAEVSEAQVIDRPALLYFGYSYCPDVCPMDLARNVAAVALLEARGRIVKPVFISVDPARDTAPQLADFTDYLHPRLLGLTGTPEQIRNAARAYRVYYKIHPPEAGAAADDYLVDHTTFSYLVLPGRGFVDFFRREETAEEMADRVSCFLDKAG